MVSWKRASNWQSNALAISVFSCIGFSALAAQTQVSLQWDFLEADPVMVQDFNEQSLRWSNEEHRPTKQTIKIRNTDLDEEMSWIEQLSDPEKLLLSEALFLEPTADLRSKFEPYDFKTFSDFWTGYGDGTARRGQYQSTIEQVSAAGFYGLLKEHNVLTAVLRSSGIGFGVKVLPNPAIEVESILPEIGNANLTWEIDVYRFPVQNVQNQSERQVMGVFRFAIRAVTQSPFVIQYDTIYDNQEDYEPSQLKITGFLQPSSNLIGISDQVPVKLELPLKEGKQIVSIPQIQTIVTDFPGPIAVYELNSPEDMQHRIYFTRMCDLSGKELEPFERSVYTLEPGEKNELKFMTAGYYAVTYDPEAVYPLNASDTYLRMYGTISLDFTPYVVEQPFSYTNWVNEKPSCR